MNITFNAKVLVCVLIYYIVVAALHYIILHQLTLPMHHHVMVTKFQNCVNLGHNVLHKHVVEATEMKQCVIVDTNFHWGYY